jgi:hypothetical protein
MNAEACRLWWAFSAVDVLPEPFRAVTVQELVVLIVDYVVGVGGCACRHRSHSGSRAVADGALR